MGARAEVFISETNADLGSYRQVANEAVLTLGAHPIEEKNFPTRLSRASSVAGAPTRSLRRHYSSGRLLLRGRAEGSDVLVPKIVEPEMWQFLSEGTEKFIPDRVSAKQSGDLYKSRTLTIYFGFVEADRGERLKMIQEVVSRLATCSFQLKVGLSL